MFEVLHHMVQDDMNVHRFVMAHRAYALIKLVGQKHAHTLLRQSVRLCAHHDSERAKHKNGESPIRKLMPKLVDQYKLAGRQLGKRQVDDKWIESTCDAIYGQGADRAAETVAAALAEGIDPESVGEAISLAANKLVLCQPAAKGRTHGDSLGVHGSDAMNAWRNMSRVLKGQSAITGLVVAAYHTAMYGTFNAPPYPTADHRKAIKTTDAKSLLAEAEDAIRHNDQGAPPPRSPSTPSRDTPCGQSSISCCGTPSAKTAGCTPKSITTRSPKSTGPCGRRSARGSSWRWPAWWPAATATTATTRPASERRATKKPAGC